MSEEPPTMIPDSEGEASDDEYADFEKLLTSSSKPKVVVASAKKTTDAAPTRQLRDRKKTHGSASITVATRTSGSTSSSLSSRTSYRSGTRNFSLDNLVAQAKKIKKRNLEIELAEKIRVENVFPDSDRQLLEPAIALDGEPAVGETGLGLDDHELGALLSRNKDSWGKKDAWDFFLTKPNSTISGHKAFPYMTLLGIGLSQDILKDPTVRAELFISGFVADAIASIKHFPSELAFWLMDEICLEQKEDLSLSYLCTLERFCISDGAIQFSPERINHLFVLLGAHENALNVKVPLIRRSGGSKAVEVVDITEKVWNLSLVLRFLGSAVPRLSDECFCQAFCLILRLALDFQLSEYGGTAVLTDDALNTFATAILEDDWTRRVEPISDTIFSSFQDISARLDILRVIPVSVVRLHMFRRRLASAFFFDDTDCLEGAFQPAILVDKFYQRLCSPEFSITHATDDEKYKNIAHSIHILDIAMDDLCGMVTANDVKQLQAYHSVLRLCTKLKELDSKVVDGAIMTAWRTEVKDTVHRVEERLRNTLLGRKSQLKQSLLGDHFKKST